ncbi:MAG: YbaK/EbsC family protein [Nitrososphaerota archaeon]
MDDISGYKKLQQFIESKGIDASIVEVKDGATSLSASHALGTEVNNIVKSILFIDESKKPVLVILGGESRVKQSKLAKMIGRKKIRLATREEVLEFTGYPAGGVPPIGCKDGLEVYVDRKIFEKGKVFAGGGSERHLLTFDASILARVYPGRDIDLPVE